MPQYTYKAMDSMGRVVTGATKANDEEGLAELLKTRGLFLMEAASREEEALAEAKAGAPVTLRSLVRLRPTGRSVPVKDVTIFTHQLNIMLRASLPAMQALEALSQQQTNKNFRAILESVWDDIKKGSSLSKSFEKHPQAFDSVFCSLLGAGEASGSVPKMLGRIGEYLDFKRELNQKLKTALTYPVVVVMTSLAVISFLVLFILPTFADIFAQFEAPLPLPTKLLLDGSELIRRFWYVFAFVIGLSAWQFQRWYEVPENVSRTQRFLLDLPAIGPVMQSLILTRILRTLGTLVQSGVPILNALELSRATAGNVVYEDLLRKVIQRVTAGQGIAAGFYETSYVPIQITNMIANAEKTGALADVLEKICEFSKKETDNSVAEMFAALEPLFVAVLGIAVGGVAACILLPIITLSSAVQ